MRAVVTDALAPPGAIVEFDAEDHSYFVDGKEKPSVTRILKDEGLGIDYGAVPDEVLEAAAERGTDVHHGCGLISLHGVKAWRERDPYLMARICEAVPATRWGYLDSFAQWAERYNWRALHVERVVYSKVHDYIGTLDGWGMATIGAVVDQPLLIDIKTRHAAIGDGYQTAAYAFAFIEQIEANHYPGEKAPAEFYRTVRATLELVKGKAGELIYHRSVRDIVIFRAAALLVNTRRSIDPSARCR